jgi:hypothetical protein
MRTAFLALALLTGSVVAAPIPPSAKIPFTVREVKKGSTFWMSNHKYLKGDPYTETLCWVQEQGGYFQFTSLVNIDAPVNNWHESPDMPMPR